MVEGWDTHVFGIHDHPFEKLFKTNIIHFAVDLRALLVLSHIFVNDALLFGIDKDIRGHGAELTDNHFFRLDRLRASIFA